MDNAKKTWWQAHKPTTRRLIQLYSALLHNAHLKGFISGQIYQGKAKYVCTPGFNCYSCPAAAGACPLGSIQNALAATGHNAGWYVLGILMLYGVILGRTICGWLCPLGLFQELLNLIPTPKIKKNRITRVLSWLKYVLLGVFVIALPLWYGLRYDLPLPGFCKYICPAGTSEGAMGLLANTMPVNTSYFSMLGVLFTRKFIIMLVIGLGCIFCYRAFCRFICPLGAIYGLFNRFNIVGVKVDEDRCNHCGACVRSCGMDVRRVGDHECINCGRCMTACSQGAISIKAGSITLKAPEKGCAGEGPEAPEKRRRMGRILWSAALVVLCFALVWFNFLDPATKKEPMPKPRAAAESSLPSATAAPAQTATPAPAAVPAAVSTGSSAPEGNGVGQKLPDFTLNCYDGTQFHLADQLGKIVVINFWATYCTPCKQELPHFSELYKEHEGDIAMLAIHSSMVTDDPVEYLDGKGYAMPFATDDEDDTVYTIVGGTGTLPQTTVLNRRGEVIYNKVGSVTPEMLAELYAQADASAPKEAAAPGQEAPAAPAAQPAPAALSSAPEGNEPGQKLPDFTLNCYDGTQFHLADQQGKIVILNFWATYCTPCKQELPHFSELYREHEGDLSMLVIHSSLVTDDPVEYLADKGYAMPFATDAGDDTVYTIVGGTGTLPQTTVLNRRGEVVYNKVGPMTPEMLAALYEEAMK